MRLEYDHATMSTGMADIDRQHQELINKLGELIDAMKSGKGKEEIAQIVQFLGHYASWHFGHEEECMARHQCPAAQANKDAHTLFIALFKEYSERIEREGPSVSLVIEIQRELGSWVRNHIVKVDTHLRACVQPGLSAARA